jgi:predicted O-methyltransferase YrrM
MKKTKTTVISAACGLALLQAEPALLGMPKAQAANDRDQRIERLIEAQRRKWRDLNIPYADGVYLRDFIIRKKVKSVIEIGTSTGHSGLWIGWGLTRTGGKLVTFEIDRRRHDIAKRFFAQARLGGHIDARLESARTGVEVVPGRIDLVFFDGDHNQYRHYFTKLAPRLSATGCFIAHNIDHDFWDVRGYLAMVRGTKGFTTEIVRPGRDAIAVTCREPAKR